MAIRASLSTNRPTISAQWLLALAVTLAVLGACGESDSNDDPDNGAGTSTTSAEAADDSAATSEPASENSSTSSPDDGTETEVETGADDDSEMGEAPDIQRLQDAIDATLERTTAGFRLDVTQTLPAVGAPTASMLRSGSFNADQQIGTGTQQFLGGAGAPADLPGYAGEEIEHRVIDDTYWLLDPVSDPPSWLGYDLVTFAELTEDSPILAVDGDLYLQTVSDAITSATDVVAFDDGSEGWTVQLVADDLLPLVVSTGVRQRLTAAGLQPTGIEATASIAVDPDGMVIGLIAELDEWWQAVVAQTIGETDSPAGMVLQFQLGEFDSVVEVTAPCANPEEIAEPGEAPALVCQG